MQTLGEVGVVLEDTRMLTHAPLARDSGEPAVIVEMDADEQIGALHRCLDPIRRSSSDPASASAAIARPFHAATTLSSRMGCGRAWRAVSNRTRSGAQRSASSGS